MEYRENDFTDALIEHFEKCLKKRKRVIKNRFLRYQFSEKRIDYYYNLFNELIYG